MSELLWQLPATELTRRYRDRSLTPLDVTRACLDRLEAVNPKLNAVVVRRDAEAIHHHYDVSNTFYSMVLGPSMAYTCAVFPTEDASLELAQEEKFDLVCRKLGLKPNAPAEQRPVSH